MVLAHRREIISQTSDKLRAAEVPHGIIQAGFKPRPLELVQVASVQTLWVRAKHAEPRVRKPVTSRPPTCW